MKRIKQWLRNYFGFSPREINGFYLLLLITGLAMAAPFIFKKSFAPTAYNPITDQTALDSLAAQLDRATPAVNYTYSDKAGKKPAVPVRLQPFNPNTATLAELMALGLSRYVANNIIKYRSKAGGFRYKEQLQRIYGLSETQYQQLYPYINLPARDTHQSAYNQPGPGNSRRYPPKPNYYPDRKSFRLQPFDLNTADTTQLKKIRGIGTKLSARIVNFRNKLGGFAQPEQLGEVYGLPPEIVDSLRKYTFIAPDFTPHQIALNAATFEELRSHPYLGYNLARLIIAYRTQHGPFRAIEDIKNIKPIDEAVYQKLKPYLAL